MNDIEHVFVIVIAKPPEAVWDALTRPEFTRQYWHSTRIRSDFQVGSRVEFLYEDGTVGCEGEIQRSDPPHELAYSWRFPNMAEAAGEAPSRVAFRLERIPAGTKLTVVHDRFPDGSKVEPIVGSGWPLVLGGLKTLLETGAAPDFLKTA